MLRTNALTLTTSDTIPRTTASANQTYIMTSRYNVNDGSTTYDTGTAVAFFDAVTVKSFGAIAQGSNTITLESEIDLKQYHHYVVCVDSSLVRVYIDGVKVGEGTAGNNNIGGAKGKLSVLSRGFLKMCRVYNAILTDEQVANNYANTIATYGGDA